MTGLKQTALLIAVSIYAVFATYQWLSASAKTSTLIEAALTDERLKAQTAANEQAEKAKLEAEAKGDELKVVYKTIKEVVYKNRVISNCDGQFPSELRLGLSEATASANSTLPTTEH